MKLNKGVSDEGMENDEGKLLENSALNDFSFRKFQVSLNGYSVSTSSENDKCFQGYFQDISKAFVSVILFFIHLKFLYLGLRGSNVENNFD